MVSRIITLLLLASLSCIATIEGNVKVIFTPSPNIPEGGTAVYNCSTNHSAVTVTWILNKTVSASTLASYGVTTPGTSTPVSSLIIPGLVDPFDNTEVLCYASGPGFVGDVISPPPVILRIQGRLEAPNNLTTVQSNDSCCYHLNWSPPFTLPGVPILGYNINITNKTNGVVLHTRTVTATEYEYCPEEFGDHIINAAAVNSVGEGDVDTFNLLINQYSIKLMDQYRDTHQNWILIVQILAMRCSINHVLMHCIDSEVEFNSTNITIDGLVTFSIPTSRTDDKNHTVTTQLSHENKMMTAMANNSLSLSFFDVSNYTDLSNVNTNVNFQCTFVKGSRAHGCCIVLKNEMNDRNYSVDIIRENNNTMTKEGAIQEAVEPGEYQIDVFDINENKSPASLPAFTSTIVIVTATSFTSMATSTATITSQVPTPTPSATTSTGSPAGPSEVTGTNPNIGIIIGSIIGSIVIVIVAVLVVGIVYVCHFKNKNMKVDCKEKGVNPSSINSGHLEIHVSTPPKLPVLNYVDIEPDPDAPAVPPPYDPDKTIYSELQKETTAISQTNVADEYNTLNHNPSTCPVDVSNADATYSTINNGQQQWTGAASPVYDTVPSEQKSKTLTSQYSMVSKEHM